ncbi:MAG: twin-arginine translocase subunit TatC [candidate division Zixibacteria bacterium]|nr:twin-arginine translocase subunit TatC [Candidatus Tariuqbacter arcticus]
MGKGKDKSGSEEGMTFLEHLEELRSRIIISLLALLIGFILTYFFTPYIIEFLIQPFLTGGESQLTLLAPTEGFMVKLKTAFLAGLMLSSPVLFYQFWRFISPGLYEKEKRFIFPVVGWSVLLFFVGAVFAYHILPFAMRFFQSFAMENVVNYWSLNRYITFAIYLLLAFGLVFELPLVIYFAARMGLVTPPFLRKYRRHAIIILLVLSALVTPPDIITQVILVIPLVVLYEISVFLAVIAVKKRDQATEC